jgi:hypothetical protein
MNRALLAGSATALLLAFSSSSASAQSCGEVAKRLADQHALHAEPPLTAPGGSAGEGVPAPLEDAKPNALARSGGAIAPPPTGDPSVIEPPPMGDSMPTAPPADTNPPATEPATPAASLSTQVSALLSAAVAASEQGDEDLCRERLDEAQTLIRKATPG